MRMWIWVSRLYVVLRLDDFLQPHDFGVVDAVEHFDLVFDDSFSRVRTHLLFLIRLQRELLARLDVHRQVHHGVGALAQPLAHVVIEQPALLLFFCVRGLGGLHLGDFGGLLVGPRDDCGPLRVRLYSVFPL